MAKTTRIDEVAESLGLQPDELVSRMGGMKLSFMAGMSVSRRTEMTEEQANEVRAAVAKEQQPRVVVEERIRPTVIRRRSRKRGKSRQDDVEPRQEAVEAQAPAAEPAPPARRASAKKRTVAPTRAGGVAVRKAAAKKPAPVQPVVEEEASSSPQPASGGAGGVMIRRRPGNVASADSQPQEPPVDVPVEAHAEAPLLEDAPVEAATDVGAADADASVVAVDDADSASAEATGNDNRVGIRIRPRPAKVEAAPSTPVEDAGVEAEQGDDGAPTAKKVSGIQIRRGVKPPAVPVVPEPSARPTQARGAVTIVRNKQATSPGEGAAKSKKSAKIRGHIDPSVIAERLAKDNKSFAPGGRGAAKDQQSGGAADNANRTERRSRRAPAAGERDSAGNNSGAPGRRNTRGRKVVNQRDLYGRRPSSGSSRRQGRGGRKGRNKAPGERTQITKTAEHKRVIKIEETINVGDLAREMGVKAGEVIKELMGLGLMKTVNQPLSAEEAEMVAQTFEFTVVDEGFKTEEFLESAEDAPDDLKPRAPAVTVMGHVDHGKTSLLDAIRNANVTASEAGGITQHIGAYKVATGSGQEIVFLDTPGHEAFTALRARGAQVTDIVILVVAADDGVMPQTVEAINHARAAEVPIVVAINKIDKPGANPQRVMQALTEYELIPEDWGGDTIFVPVSALERTGIDDLLEMIVLQSELLELQANPDKPARGVVLEAYKDVGRGTVATLIIQEGTLRAGDIVVSGSTYGRVRTMGNDKGQPIEIAGPSTPVEVTGLSEVPDAGEAFFVAEDDRVARDFTSHVGERQRQAELASRRLDPWAALKETKSLALIIKGDVQGSVEALQQSLVKLSTEEVEVNIIHAAVGGITESDVQLAVASNAIVIGFNTRPENRATELAKRENVNFELHSVIYDVTDRVRNAMAGLLDPILEEEAMGQAEVRDTFQVPKVGTVAGTYVIDGRILRGAKARVVRDSRVIYDSRISTLRRFKDDVREVKAGFECGLSIDNFNDIKIGDVIEVYEVKEVKATL